MISEQLDPGRWKLTFGEQEGAFLVNVLARMADHYAEDIADLPPKLQTFWQSGSSINVEARDADESRDVLSDSRDELRSERRVLAESWVREFEIAEQRDPWVIELTTAERDEFVCMLNDRRLILGMEIGVTAEGKLHPDVIADENHRLAIMEIDVLGHFVMVTLGPQIYRP